MTEHGKPPLVELIADAIKRLEDKACDLAVDGDMGGSEELMKEVEELRERETVGELYHFNM